MSDTSKTPGDAGKEPVKVTAAEEKPSAATPDDGYTSIFDAPVKKPSKTEEEKAHPGKKKMSKQLFAVIIAAAVCVALTGGIFAINAFIDKPESTSSTASDDSVTYIYDYSDYLSSAADTEYLNIGGITKVNVMNKSTAFVTEPQTEIKTTTDSSTGETTTKESLSWKITDVPDVDITGVNFSSATIGYILADVFKVSYFGVYAEDVNAEIPSGGMTYFEECGFNDPTAKFEIFFADGSEITLYVGSLTPTQDGYFVYADCRPDESSAQSVTADGETIPILGRPQKTTKVYKSTQDAIAFLIKDLGTVVEKQIVEQFSTEDTANTYYSSGALIKFDSVTLFSKTLGKTVSFSCTDTSTPASSNIYFMNAPENFNPDTDRVDELLSPLADGLRSSGCYAVSATAEDKTKYGFDDPLATVTYVADGKTVKMTVAKGIEADNYAVMIDGQVSIYKVDSSKLYFVNVTLEKWHSSLLYANNITNVDYIEMKVKNSSGSTVSTRFDLEHLTDDSSDDLAVTTSSGKTIDTDAFRDMYSSIISTSLEGEYVTDGKESSSPAIEIAVHYVGYISYDVLKYSDYTARRYYFTLNGKNGAPVLSTLVDTISEKYFALLGD